jgi:hypothetical protein
MTWFSHRFISKGTNGTPSPDTMSKINMTWVPLGFSSIIVIDRDLTSSSAQELLGEIDLVIVNYDGDHFVSWLRYYPLYVEHAISATRIDGDSWYKALSKTRLVRLIQSKLPDNPFGSEMQLASRHQPTSLGESDMTVADIQVANVSLADELQSYDPTQPDSMSTSQIPPTPLTSSTEMPYLLTIDRDDISHHRTCQGISGTTS